jgi:hypothetical protein
MTAPKVSLDEFGDALGAMQTDATLRLVAFFHHARLVYDPGLAGKIMSRISTRLAEKMTTADGHAAIEGGKAVELIRSTISEILELVAKAAGTASKDAGITSVVMSQVKDRAMELATGAFGNFAAQAAPFVGLLPSAYAAVTKSYAAVEGVVKAVHASRYAKLVRVGSPRAAADAAGTILQRKAAYLSTTATTSLINLGAGIANAATTGIATAADVSIKVATKVTELVAELTMFAIELFEHAAGEQVLSTIGGWDHELLIEDDFAEDLFPVIFDVCPLLGCYMLASAPYFNTSDFVTLSAGPGTLASVDEVERIAVNKVNPLRLYASQIIVESKVRLTHDNRSDLNKIMQQAGLRAQAVEAKSLKGRAKKAIAQHITEPLKKKWAALRA